MNNCILQKIFDLGSRFDKFLDVEVHDKLLIRVSENKTIKVYSLQYLDKDTSKPFRWGVITSSLATHYSSDPRMQTALILSEKHGERPVDSEAINLIESMDQVETNDLENNSVEIKQIAVS